MRNSLIAILILFALPAFSAPKAKGLHLSSPAFQTGETLDTQFTALGENLSPPLSWSGAPPLTKEFALIVDDPDAAPFFHGKSFTHWVIYGISTKIHALPKGLPQEGQLTKPAGVRQGKNSAGQIGYFGPKPPAGSGPHHYHFQLYALNAALDLQSGMSQEEVFKAIHSNVIARDELIGLYEVKK